MKLLTIAALLLFSGASLYAQDVAVQGNSRVNTDFSKYKTFAWAKTDATAQEEGYDVYTYSEERSSPVLGTASAAKSKTRNNKNTRYVYSYNVIVPATNATVNSTIQSAITSELEGRGYSKTGGSSDLLISYKVLEKKARVKGYVNDYPTVVGDREVRQVSDTTSQITDPGTLFINLIDNKTQEVVWQGYASGLYKENSFVNDQAEVKEAVNLIFEKFKYRADKVKSLEY